MSVGFRNITKCQIKSKISASDTTVLLEKTADYVPFISSQGDYVYAVFQDQYNKEIVKIDVSASSVYGLSVERGQESTSARAWVRGSLFYQDLTAESLEVLRQKEVFRTIAYNPNGITAPAYANEKIYQTGATECEKRWWKSVNGTNLVWLLIAGVICEGEEWVEPSDWDWDVPEAWEWPAIVYKVAPLVFLPPGGSYSSAQDVDIFCPTLNSTIYYTIDGSEPDETSTEYTGLVSLSIDTATEANTTTLKAIAYKTDFGESPIASDEYSFPPLWKSVSGCSATMVGQSDTDDTWWGWGAASGFQLHPESSPALIPVRISDLTTWTKIVTTTYCFHAIKNDGTLWGRGKNGYGTLGLGDKTTRWTFTQVGSGTNWAKIFADHNNVMAIKTDGTLWGWGRNGGWSLGLGDTTERLVPTQVGVATDWASVTFGEEGTIALKTNGEMWGWGLNNYAVLGLGHTNYVSTPTQIGGGLSTWKKVSQANRATIALKTDGTLWAWGDNIYGQCGQGTLGEEHQYDYQEPTQIGTSTAWAETGCGSFSMMAVMNDGTLWGWGANSLGNLGIGNRDMKSTPFPVAMYSTDWDKPIENGYGSTTMHVLKTDKTLYSVGYYGTDIFTGGASIPGSLGLGTLTSDELEERPISGSHIEYYIHYLAQVRELNS